jgi:hypothetical protein
MQSAQEFMNAFLREQAELLRGIRRQNRDLYEKFFTKDLLAFISDWHEVRDKNPQSFALAEVTDDSARVTTTELISGRQFRYRYHLRKSSENWEIYKKEGSVPCAVDQAIAVGNHVAPAEVSAGMTAIAPGSRLAFPSKYLVFL